MKEATFILSEDTRESKKLLDKYLIDTPLVSYRDQNHEKMICKILEKLGYGYEFSIDFDAGTPFNL